MGVALTPQTQVRESLRNRRGIGARGPPGVDAWEEGEAEEELREDAAEGPHVDLAVVPAGPCGGPHDTLTFGCPRGCSIRGVWAKARRAVTQFVPFHL